MPKILIAEDDEMNRDMLTRRLQRRGYEIIVADNGEQAIAIAPDAQPDLILMDMSMPVLDGWEATKQIKANPVTKSIPVIGLSAHAMATDREKAIAAGCDDYDTKPIDMNRLVEKIEKWLAK
jgi:two-component system, cell cycle response regulator DivK